MYVAHMRDKHMHCTRAYTHIHTYTHTHIHTHTRTHTCTHTHNTHSHTQHSSRSNKISYPVRASLVFSYNIVPVILTVAIATTFVKITSV